MNEPLVSVILPTRNRADTIVASVRSVLDQSYRNLELLIVDDASTDDTKACIDELTDPRIRWIRLDRQAGASTARNIGIEQACGAWIAFQDSDDVWLPGKLEKQVARVRDPAANVIAAFTSYWRHDGVTRVLLPQPGSKGMEGDVLPRLLKSNFISTQVLMVRRDVALAVGGFDDQLSALNDWDFVIRIARHGAIAWVPEPLVEYVLQPDSLTKSIDAFVHNYEMMMIKHAGLMTARPEDRAWHLAVIGNRLCREGHRARGRSYLARAWRLLPFDYRYGGAWLLSWMPLSLYRSWTRIHAKRRRS